MTTPRKNFNYCSPYAKPVKEYPSQSVDYISLDMGGPMQQSNAATPSSNEKTPGPNNLKYYQQNYRNSNSKANRRNLFNNNYGQQNRQSFNQQQRNGPRYSKESPQQHQNIRNSNEKRHKEQQYHHNDKSIASYCHPSMTEDPWFTLMQRIRALESSKISPKESSPPLDTNSNTSSDHDQAVDSAASD